MFSWVPEILTTEAKTHSIYSNKCLSSSLQLFERQLFFRALNIDDSDLLLTAVKVMSVVPKMIFLCFEFLEWSQFSCVILLLFFFALWKYFLLIYYPFFTHITYVTHLYMCVGGVYMYVHVCGHRHTHGAQSTTAGVDFLFPLCVPGTHTYSQRVCGTCLCELSLLASPSGNIFENICIIPSDWLLALHFTSEACVLRTERPQSCFQFPVGTLVSGRLSSIPGGKLDKTWRKLPENDARQHGYVVVFS